MWNHLSVPAFQILSVCTANICRSPATETFLRHDLAHELAGGHITVNSFGTHAIPDQAACDLSTALASALLGPPSPVADSTATTPGSTTPGSTTPRPTHPTIPAAGTRSNYSTPPDPGTARGGQADSSTPASGTSQLVASATRPPAAPGHSSRRVTAEGLQPADLILALDRNHRSALAKISPRSRPRTFTVRQAAALATHIHSTISAGELPDGAPPIPPPGEINARLVWLVTEMDAARGVGFKPTEAGSPEAWHPLDVPDPHVVGYQIHAPVVELIRSETLQISATIRAVLQM